MTEFQSHAAGDRCLAHSPACPETVPCLEWLAKHSRSSAQSLGAAIRCHLTTLTTQDVQAFIEAHGVSARLLRNIGHTPTVPAAAEALGVHPDQIVKTLLFLVDTGDADGQPVRAVVVISNGTNRVDKKALAARFGVGKQARQARPARRSARTAGLSRGRRTALRTSHGSPRAHGRVRCCAGGPLRRLCLCRRRR